MSKTITIIQLLNKIANGEEPPENIKYHNRNLKESDIMLCCKENIIDKLDCNSIYLNDEVEIIEEQEEIDIRKLDFLVEYESFEDYDCRDIGIAITKINKITKTINKIVDLIQQRNDKFKNIEIRLEQLDKNIKEK